MFIGDQQSRLFSWLFYISKPCLTRITTRLTSVIFIQDERMLLFIIQLLRVEPSKWQNKCTAILYSYLQSRQPVYRTYGSLCTSKTVTLSLFHWWIYWLQHLDNKFLIRCFGVWYRLTFLIVVCILTRFTGSALKYGTTRKNTQRYYRTKRLITRFIIQLHFAEYK